MALHCTALHCIGKILIKFPTLTCNVADKDPGSSAFLPLGSWIRIRDGKNLDPDTGSGLNITDHFSESLGNSFFGLNLHIFLDADPGYFKPWVRDGKIRIRDKHPGFATL
jgi:hypothetical protein